MKDGTNVGKKDRKKQRKDMSSAAEKLSNKIQNDFRFPDQDV